MLFKVLRVFVLLTLGIVFASCSGLAIQVAFDLDGPVLLNDQEDMLLGASHYSIRFDEAIKKVATGNEEISATTTGGGPNFSVSSATVDSSDPTKLDISFTSSSSLKVGETITITITIPEGYLTDEADNPNLEIERKVTVVQGTKSDLNTLTLTYAEVKTTEGTATTGTPTWAGDAPTNITYSITAQNVPGSDGSGTTVVIAPTTGQITITDAAVAGNSGAYTVTATAGETSNYAHNSTQTATVTVLIASSKATITELTLEIGGNNYSINFGAGTSAKVVLPAGTSIPNSATVESVTLSTGASGLTQDATVSINNNGVASIRITAEDGITTKEYIVTVSIAKPELNTVGLTYAEVTTTEGTANDTGVEPAWDDTTHLTPTYIAYSITDSTINGPRTNGSGTTVVIAPTTGQITITADAIPDNSGTYTVTATAGATSNYADTTKQIATVTVKVKGNLSNYSFSYPIAVHNSADGNINVNPVWWRKGTTKVAAPAGVSYVVSTSPPLPAEFTLHDGTISGTMSSLDKVTAYQITAAADNTDYVGSTTGTFLDTFLLEEYTQATPDTATAVSTVDELKAIAPGGEYYLTNHIDLNNTAWTPIASSASPFTGKLHGNGYAIYNLTITSSETYQGLFASVSGATIENLGIGVTSITGLAGVGALAGVAKENASLGNIAVVPMVPGAEIVATSSTAIEDGASTGALLGGLVGLQRSGSLMGYSLVPVEGTGNKVGGLVGESNNATVNGFTTGAVTGKGSKVGGLVGESNNATVNGFTTGAVTGTGNYVGGLVGFNDTGTVSGHAMGAVSGKEYTGGLVGQSTAGGTVSGYATGAVTGDKYVGGLVGASSGPVTGYTTGVVSGTANIVGGLVGFNNGTVSGYATGAVSGTNNLGGLVGYNSIGTVRGYATGAVVSGTDSNSVGGLVGSNGSNPVNGYWDIQSTKQATSEGGSTAVGISATKNIVFNDTTGTYTDLNNSNTIFNITAFTAIFDTANGANKTWPKLKDFPFPQPTVTVSASNENIIEVTPPEVAQSPE